jgi:Holliday junction resolvase RusA-like endonuclease
MEYKLVIPARLPGLNDYQYACRSHYSKGAKMKREWVMIVCGYIQQQLKDIHIDKKIKIDYYWYEPNKKRDLDNISGFGKKVIQDALIKMCIIKNDGWENIIGFSDNFYVDKENPRVEIIIKEIL